MYAHVVSRLFVYFYVASLHIWRKLRFAPPIFFQMGPSTSVENLPHLANALRVLTVTPTFVLQILRNSTQFQRSVLTQFNTDLWN
jgi:hypothetical protein